MANPNPALYTTIIQPAELAGLLADSTCRMRLFDCRARPGGEATLQQAYIPESIPLQLDTDLSGSPSSDSGRHPLPNSKQFRALMSAYGVTKETQVVAYDDLNQGLAARLWWLLKWQGHEGVAVLDGGFRDWIVNRHPWQAQALESVDSGEFLPAPAIMQPISVDTLEQTLSQGKVKLVDARSRDRFLGLKEPLDRKPGHIPDSINMPFTESLDGNGKLLPIPALRNRFSPILDKQPVESVVHSCGSGVTACVNLLAMEHAGYKGSKLYVGSWSEWIQDENRPIARG